MKKFAVLCSAAFAIFIVSGMYAQSLGDLAEKERQRREAVKNDRVITDEEAAKFIGEPSPASSAGSQTAPAQAAGPNAPEATEEAAAKPPKADPDEPVDFQGRTESYWREAMANARKEIADLENEANVLELRLNDLQNKFNGAGLDGGGDNFRRGTIQREMQKSYYERDLNKEKLAKAKESLQALENEARASGALPGWLEAPRK